MTRLACIARRRRRQDCDLAPQSQNVPCRCAVRHAAILPQIGGWTVGSIHCSGREREASLIGGSRGHRAMVAFHRSISPSATVCGCGNKTGRQGHGHEAKAALSTSSCPTVPLTTPEQRPVP